MQLPQVIVWLVLLLRHFSFSHPHAGAGMKGVWAVHDEATSAGPSIPLLAAPEQAASQPHAAGEQPPVGADPPQPAPSASEALEAGASGPASTAQPKEAAVQAEALPMGHDRPPPASLEGPQPMDAAMLDAEMSQQG